MVTMVTISMVTIYKHQLLYKLDVRDMKNKKIGY